MFDYINFPSFTHTTGMTHFLDLRVISLAEHVAHSRGRKIHIRFSCGNLKKEQIGRTRVRWRDDIGIDLKK